MHTHAFLWIRPECMFPTQWPSFSIFICCADEPIDGFCRSKLGVLYGRVWLLFLWPWEERERRRIQSISRREFSFQFFFYFLLLFFYCPVCCIVLCVPIPNAASDQIPTELFTIFGASKSVAGRSHFLIQNTISWQNFNKSNFFCMTFKKRSAKKSYLIVLSWCSFLSLTNFFSLQEKQT